MTLGLQTGNVHPVHRFEPNPARPQTHQFRFRVPPFERNEFAAVDANMPRFVNETADGRERTGYKRIKFLRWLILLNSLADDIDVIQLQHINHVTKELGLLLSTFDQGNGKAGRHDCQRQTGQTGARSDIQYSFAMEKGRRHQAIQQMQRHHGRHVPYRGQVISLPPFCQQGEVLQQLSPYDSVVGQRQIPQAPAELPFKLQTSAPEN